MTRWILLLTAMLAPLPAWPAAARVTPARSQARPVPVAASHARAAASVTRPPPQVRLGEQAGLGHLTVLGPPPPMPTVSTMPQPAPAVRVDVETLVPPPDGTVPQGTSAADGPADSQPTAAATGTALNAVTVERVANTPEPSILLRAARDVGLAAFLSGNEVVIVLDAPIDFQIPERNLGVPFAQMTSRRTQDATVICIPATALQTLRLVHDPRGWIVVQGTTPSATAGIEPKLIENDQSAGYLQLAASAPSRVVTIVDPQTGGRLLIGTQDQAGEAVQSEHQEIQFTLLPTLQGVVIAAKSDDIELQQNAGGFALRAGPHAGGKIISGSDRQDPGAPAATPLSQVFNIPNDTIPTLTRKLRQQIDFAANAPSLARSAPRERVAATMVALGMGVEASAVLDVAAAADPVLRDNPRVMGLRAVAAVLSHRLEGAGALDDPRLTGSVEVELWRALTHLARNRTSQQDARSFSAALPLLLAYPRTLRDRLLPKALEVMALNGQEAAAQAALKSLPDAELDLERGMVLEMTNQPAAALNVYQQVAARPDRIARYKALVRAVGLRMKGGELDAKAGADALDRALFAWRDASLELPLRLRIANLRREAGQWREALTALREARALFPDDQPQIDHEIGDVFTGLFTDDAAQRLSPSDFVALFDENQDIVKSLAWSVPVGLKLVDHLGRLGLPARAQLIMAQLVTQARDPAERTGLGTRLASIRMVLDDPAGAIAALAETTPPAGVAVDPAVMSARQLLYAHAESERGNKDRALSMLELLDVAEADEMRADIYTARKDWPHTIAALTAMEHKLIPTATSLTDDQQALVLRLAEAATLGADTATLARLNATYSAAMATGRSAALFRIINSAPVRETADLPRAFEEIQLARRLTDSQGKGAGI